MSFADFVRKASAAAGTVAKALSSSTPESSKRPYKVCVTLHVRAPNKGDVEKTVKALKAQFDRVGASSLAQMLGIMESIRVVDVEVEVGKEE